VLEAPKEGFLGRSVWNLMHSIGLRWGDLDVFNWETEAEWSDAALFWVGTSTEPGYFLPEEIAEDKRYADLTFAMGVGSKPQPEAIAKAMIAFAGVVKEKLGGTLRTSRGEALDANAFVRAVVRLHADLEARGFPPGAPHTVELLGTLSI
jgi:cell division protein ZipA